MKEQGISKAALGLRYLIKYANHPNEAYFEVIKTCEAEIKLWSLITLFSNNMDDLWENVPEFIFHDIFTMQEIETTEGFLEYGRGYHSNSNLSFKEQFKIIRDKIAHGSFTYQDGSIYIEDGCDTSFDLLWLEKLVLSTIANVKNDFKKGMNDFAIFSLMLDGKKNDFGELWNSGRIHLYRITLLSNNKNSLAGYFKDAGIDQERFTFDLLFNAVKYKFSTYRMNSSLFFANPTLYLQKIFRKIENYFGGFVKLELVSKKQLDDWTFIPGFENLSFNGKLQYLINKLKMSDPYSYNSIMVMNLFEILNDVKEGIYNTDQLFILRDAGNFFLKVYANILFPGIYEKKDNDLELKEYLYENFDFETHFVYAKNVYKEYIRVIKRCYDEVCNYNGSKEYKTYLLSLIHHYTNMLEDAIENHHDKNLFWNIRNAITHNQIEFQGEMVRLYVTGRDITLKHFNKKKGEWVIKEFKNNRVIWEMIINKEEFLHLMDKLYEFADIPTSINISKYVRRKNKG